MYTQTLYKILENVVPEKVLNSYNKKKAWKYDIIKNMTLLLFQKTAQLVMYMKYKNYE